MPVVCLHGQFKEPFLRLFLKMASPDTGRFPAYVSMDPGQAKAQADKATYVPIAMPLVLQPRHQLIHSLCT